MTQRVLLREGTGRKNDPFVYWLPGDEERLKQPVWQKEMEELIERMNRVGQEETGALGGGKPWRRLTGVGDGLASCPLPE